jgi:NAD(P)-dependent dehydrogenase (short-subunit alcohol dehydrogenase family)
MDLSKLKGGVAVLTGAASGLGLSMAKQACKQGMHVVVSDVRPSAIRPAVESLQQEYPSCQVRGIVCDVTDPASVASLLTATQSFFPSSPIQFIAANAGVIFPRGTILTATPAEWDLTYRVNVLGVANTLRVFVPVMLKQPEQSVVEVTASAAGVSFGSVGPYGTSKQAALGVAEALHRELETVEGALDKVHVVALCPAIVTTGLLETSTEMTKSRDDIGFNEGMQANGR